MRTFIILWVGQIVSSVGSSMTYFALTLWVWEQTQSATAISLILFFYQLPQIAIALLSGILVDQVPRKYLLVFSDTGAACCTLLLGILSVTQTLQLWQIYWIAAVIGCFGNIQSLTYITTVPLIVPKQHHTRALSMGSMVGYGSGIVAPAFAGLLYPQMGLLGITLIDLTTFAIAILTLLIMPIPQTIQVEQMEHNGLNIKATAPNRTVWQDVTFGFRYIASQPSLRAMVIALSAFAFFNQMSEVLYSPLILARTGGNAQVLGMVVAAGGVGGVAGAIGLSVWNGFRQRVVGIVWGFIGTGFCRLILGISYFPGGWVVAQFGASLHSPLIFSSYTAVWYAKVPPSFQGRVFAADSLIGLVIESTASLSAGFLADQVFEPLMQSRIWLSSILHSIVGTGIGSGIAFLYVIISLCMVLTGIVSFTIRQLREAETLIPDYETTKEGYLPVRSHIL